MQTREEIEQKRSQVKATVQQWVDKQGHDRCWYYPDFFSELATLLDITQAQEPHLPPREDFEEDCRCYQEEYKRQRGKE